ncbi:DUF4041 domain-containing protein, partial [Streptomyces sp. NPDC050698]
MQVDPVIHFVVTFALVVSLGVVIALLVLLLRQRKATTQFKSRFAGVIDADAELARVVEEAAKRRAEADEIAAKYRVIETRYKSVTGAEEIVNFLEKQAVQIKNDVERTRAEYREKRGIYDRLVKEVAIFDERLSFAEMGVYEPHFDFADSDQYKEQVEEVRSQQKLMISAGTAVTCSAQWSVDGSEAKGRTMTNRAIKMTLRAFNGECDAAIANTRWNNVNAMEKRIERARDQINKLNESNRVVIEDAYATLKFDELFLTHELREKLKAEKDERAEAARASREEQKLLRDIEAAEEAEAR